MNKRDERAALEALDAEIKACRGLRYAQVELSPKHARVIRRLANRSTRASAEDDGVALIGAERARRIAVEGWAPEHDDGHADGALAISAAAYAWPPDFLVRGVAREEMWPFGSCGFKPGDRIRELTKAGALIAAEIDRLRRAGTKRKR